MFYPIHLPTKPNVTLISSWLYCAQVSYPLTWSLKKDSRIYFFLVVTSTLPRFFHKEYKYDEFGNGTYMTTSLYRDKTYNLFWHSWQSLTNTCIPSIALCTINGKILWHLAKSKQIDAKISQNNGLRIHVGWVVRYLCKISFIQWILIYLTAI